jgi:tetratricopeptide (TPR) repeat protein
MRTELLVYKTLFDGEEEHEVPEELMPALERIRKDEGTIQDYLDIADRYREIERPDKEFAALELALDLGHDDLVFYHLARNRAGQGQYAEAYQYIKRMHSMHGMAKLLYLKILGELGKVEKLNQFWQTNRSDSELKQLIKQEGLDHFPKNVRKLLREEF